MAEHFGVIEVFIASGSAGGICVLALWSSRNVGTAGSIIGLYLYGLFGGKQILVSFTCSRSTVVCRSRHRPCRRLLRSNLTRA